MFKPKSLCNNCSYEQDDGQIFGEERTLQPASNGEPAIFAKGGYSFVGPDGQTYWVNYYADEFGFHPQVGTGPVGGPQPGFDPASINPTQLKSLVGK